MRIHSIGLLFFLILLVPAGLQGQEKLADVDLYKAFSQEYDLLFLKGLGANIDECRITRNVRALCACSALLFYAERITGQKHPKVDGMSLLREATLIAWTDKDIASLRAVEGVWRSKVFGPGDETGAEEVQKYIAKITEEEVIPVIPPEKDPSHPLQKVSPVQARLMAEESARLDGLQQIAERIYGVMIQSLSEVKDFKLTRDVVVATLKPSLMVGAQFSSPVEHGDEIHVTVTLQRSFIVKTVQQFYKQKVKNLDWLESDKFERNLLKEYRAVGIAYIK